MKIEKLYILEYWWFPVPATISSAVLFAKGRPDIAVALLLLLIPIEIILQLADD